MRSKSSISRSNEMIPLTSGTLPISYSPINSSDDYEQLKISTSADVRAKRPFCKSDMSRWYFAYFGIILLVSAVALFVSQFKPKTLPIETSAWSSVAAPFSIVNPADLNISVVDRPFSSRPGLIFAGMDPTLALPTNSWYENLFLGGANNSAQENNVFQVPYIIDTSGFVPGVRTHPAHVQANDRTVMVGSIVSFLHYMWLFY